MTGLHVAPDLELPLDLVTEPIGILANRGRGKSYATHVLVEEIHDAGVPVVVLDVKGDWWGLRSSADGSAAGMPFYIFGGDHADLPLEHTAGELLADLVVDERVSVVLDLSHMSKTKQRSFTVAFAERLYHRNRDPLFVVVDEADVLIPQRATAETARLIGAMEDIAKRGRGRGIGMAVVTQRPQEVAKSVLDLMDTLVLLGMTGPRSLKSVREWVSVHVDEDRPGWSVVDTLPTLPVGTAWVWSPMHDLQQRIKVRTVRTFDSHVTPKPNQKRITPRTRVELDLAALGDRITATVERAQADDPRLLRRRITELEQALEAERSKPTPTPETVEIPTVSAEVLVEYSTTAGRLLEQLSAVEGMLHAAHHQLPTEGKQGQPTTRRSAPRANQTSSTTGRAPEAGPSTTRKNPPATRDTAPPAAGGPLRNSQGKLNAQGKLLNALVQHGTPLTVVRLALVSGYSSKSSGFKNALGALRSAGYAQGGREAISATDLGAEVLGPVDPLPTGPELVEHWMANLGKAERDLLEQLLEVWPDALTHEELADACGRSPLSSGFKNALGRLRTLQLATGGREAIHAADELGEAR